MNRPPGGPWHDGPPSDHFDGTRFLNPAGPSHPDAWTSVRWLATRDRRPWPDWVAVEPSAPPARVDGMRVTFVNHATVLVQSAGRAILLDPLWSERASPLQWAGPKRHHAPGVPFDALPPIDLIVVSHSHYDHMDAPTLRRLRDRDAPACIAPLGCDVPLTAEVPGLSVTTLDWGGTAEAAGMRVTALPCRHWSQRYPRDRDLSLWAAFRVDTSAGAVLLMGDTGFDEGRPYRAAAAAGPLRLAVLPIGAYAPRWHMVHEHQDPAQAVEGFRLCGAQAGVAMHWGCFRMTDEGRDDPLAALEDAKRAQGVERFRSLQPGEGWDM